MLALFKSGCVGGRCMLWLKESIEQLLSKLHTNLDTGLTKEQVKQKHLEFGRNEFEEEKKSHFFKK